MTHQVVKTETGYGIQRLASGATYGSFENFAEAMEAMREAGLADQRAVSAPEQY